MYKVGEIGSHEMLFVCVDEMIFDAVSLSRPRNSFEVTLRDASVTELVCINLTVVLALEQGRTHGKSVAVGLAGA